MDKMKRLSETLRTLIEGEFSGYIKINFSQGSLGRVEKSEEFEDTATILEVETRGRRNRAVAEMERPGSGAALAEKLPVMLLAIGITAIAGAACAAEMREIPSAHTPAAQVRSLKPGDTAEINFLCRLRTGELAASSGPVVPDERKSKLFLLRGESGALPLRAAEPAAPLKVMKEQPFEQEILDRIALQLAGMQEGEKRRMTLTASDIAARDEQNYVSRISRVRTRPKEMRMTPGEYEFRARKTAEVGQKVALYPDVSGSVERVTADEVLVRFAAEPSVVINTSFGPARIRETENAWEIIIDARPGDIVRTGVFAGRIVAVDEQTLTIDYRHPFGGEPLQCDVTVEKIADPIPVPAGAGA